MKKFQGIGDYCDNCTQLYSAHQPTMKCPNGNKRRYAPGCWGDGSFGHQHVRERLAALVEEYDDDLAERLRAEMSDDAEEELDAIDLLNDRTDTAGLVWEFVDGDLMLSRLISENSGR